MGNRPWSNLRPVLQLAMSAFVATFCAVTMVHCIIIDSAWFLPVAFFFALNVAATYNIVRDLRRPRVQGQPHPRP